MSSNCVDVNSSSSSSTTAPGEKLCYIPCRFCSIILAVSVPCSSLLDIVTVRCGHCANLWSVNMGAALHSLSSSWQHQQQQHQLRSLPHQRPQPPQRLKQPPHPPPQPLQHHHRRRQDFCLVQTTGAMTAATNYRLDLAGTGTPAVAAGCNKLPGEATAGSMMRSASLGISEERTAIINRRKMDHPPEKKQRVPSAYNQFIKEEIQRIKANNPDISHREAFSAAAKNWAHFPHIQFGLMLENNSQARLGDRGL